MFGEQEGFGAELFTRVRVTHSALDDKIEEQRILTVNFVEPPPLAGCDESILLQRAGLNYDIDTAERVITTVDEPMVKIGPLKQTQQGFIEMVKVRDRRNFRVKGSFVRRLVHHSNQQVDTWHPV